MKKITIQVSEQTKKALQNLGKKCSTYDEIIKALISHARKCDLYWSDRFD